MTYRYRLFLFFATLTAVVVLTAMVVVNWRFGHYTGVQIRDELVHAPFRFDDFHMTRMENLLTLAANVSTDARLRGSVGTGDRSTIEAAAEETYSTYRSNIFWLLDPEGQVWIRLDQRGLWGDTLSNLSIVRDAMKGFDSGNVWLHKNRLYQVVASPIMSGQAIQGILIIGYRFDNWLTKEFAALTNMEISFLKDNAELCSSLDLELVKTFGASINLPIRTLVENQVEFPPVPVHNGKPRTGETPFIEFNMSGESYAGAVFSMRDLHGTHLANGVVFRSVQREEELLARIQKALLLVIFGAVVVSFILAYILSRSLTNPIYQLVESSRRLGEGDLDHPIPSMQKDEIGTLANALDEMRQSLLIARSDLIRSERLSAIGQMASGILHDFRQPITAIYGYMDLLALPEVKDEKRGDYRDKVVRQVDNMLGMVNELLDFARGEVKLVREEVDLHLFLKDIVESFQIQAKASYINLKCVIHWKGKIEIDEGRMRRVVENLLRNSLQAIKQKGSISMSLDSSGDNIVIGIKDDGVGIDDENMERLFEPFFTEGKRSGTGLGLAVVKRVVEEHGGSIEVESEVGKGTQFSVRLPAANVVEG